MKVMSDFLTSNPDPSTEQEFLIRKEIAEYLQEETLKDTNVYDFYRANNQRFKYLTLAALTFIGTLATQTTSERLFSTTGKIVSPERAQLLGSNVEMIAFLHYNTKEK